jgi:hypothetical protein|tara:strand:- start:20 stop:778 length:759 start_codon:yes stop_codon:yes gene_type:complete
MTRIKYSPHGIDGATVTKKRARIILQGIDFLLQRKDSLAIHLANPQPIGGAVGVENNFMYRIEQVEQDQTVKKSEIGIGKLTRSDEGLELVRLNTIGKRGVANMYCPDTYLRVTTYMPTSIIDLYNTDGETVIVYNGDGSIEAVPLTHNSFLGRLGSDEVRSVTYQEIIDHFPFYKIPELIQSLEEQLKLKTRRLDLTNDNATVSAPILRVNPDKYSDTTRPTPQQGMIIYNQDSQSLEFYDGEQWRALVFQ